MLIFSTVILLFVWYYKICISSQRILLLSKDSLEYIGLTGQVVKSSGTKSGGCFCASPVGTVCGGGALSAVAQPAPRLLAHTAITHPRRSSALGEDHSVLADGQRAHQPINHARAVRMSAKGSVPSTKLQEQLSVRELLFLGEMICYLFLK